MAESEPSSSSESILRSVKVEVTVALGKAKLSMRELSKMAIESVYSLDCSVDDPVTLYVGEKRVAEGVLEEAEGDEAGMVAVRVKRVFDQPE